MSDGCLHPDGVGGRKMRKHQPCQGWWVRAFPCHLSRRLCCPSVIYDGEAKNRDLFSGKAICSLSLVISGENKMCPKRAQPFLPL